MGSLTLSNEALLENPQPHVLRGVSFVLLRAGTLSERIAA